MTDWLWEIKERAEQKERFIDYRKNRVLFYSPEEQHRRMIMKQRMVGSHGHRSTSPLTDPPFYFPINPEPRSILEHPEVQLHDDRLGAGV